MLVLAQVSADDPWLGLYEIGWAVEGVLLFVTGFLALWGIWRYLPLSTQRLVVARPNPGLGVVRAALVFAALWFVVVLNFGAATDIIGPFYTTLYTSLALSVLFLGGFMRPIMDLYHPADVIERGNLAAALVIGGFVLGTAFAFGGALTGEGPGWWVVVVFFLLAYVELRANMSLVSRLSGSLKDDVRLERDVSAGLLLGAVAWASGLVSGRAAAGDFLGWEHGLRDYVARLWWLLPIAGAGALAGLYSRHSERKLAIRAAAAAFLVVGAFAVYLFT